MKNLIQYKKLYVILIWLLIALCVYSIREFDRIWVESDFFRERMIYTIRCKNNLTIVESLDSLKNINPNLKKPTGTWRFKSQRDSISIVFWARSHGDSSVVSITRYIHDYEFKKRYKLFFCGDNRRYIYGIRSNYEATKAVQDAFETEVLPLFASEFHQISPIRDKAWWIKRDFQVLYFPIGSLVLACVFIPILACALRRNADKIRALKAEQNKSRKEE